MSRRNRPNAWDVSFPSEPAGASAALRGVPGGRPSPTPSSTSGSDGGGQKRRAPPGATLPAGNPNPVPPMGKRPRLTRPDDRVGAPTGPKLSYVPTPRDVREDARTVVFGEDPLERDGASLEEKPVRALSDFAIFDPSSGFELTSLSLLDGEGARGRQFEAAGFVAPVFLNEEDEGQEDGLEEDEDPSAKLQRLRTSAVFRYTIDYTKTDDPVYIETQFSWFELRAASVSYQQVYRDFYRPHRLVQIMISDALHNTSMTVDDFSACYFGAWDTQLAEYIQEEDFIEAIPLLKSTVEELEEGVQQCIHSCPFIHHLLQQPPSTPLTRLRHHIPAPHPTNFAALTGNPDLAVLRSDAQNPTHVSPLIDTLALGLFHEHLKVVGPPPKQPTQHVLKQRRTAMLTELLKLINHAREPEDRVEVTFPYNQRLQDQYWASVVVDGVTYKPGDCVIIEAQRYSKRPKPKLPYTSEDLPENAQIADFCWFAKIIWIDQLKQQFHVQWYEHGSKTILQELYHPQELFLWPTCTNIHVKTALGKARVHDVSPGDQELGPLDYYCRYVYNEVDASFTSVDQKATTMVKSLGPPSNCLSCHLQNQQSEEESTIIADDALHYGGHNYHCNDFVLYTAEEGPANVGRITQIQVPKSTRSPSVTIHLQCLGRTSSLLSHLTLTIDPGFEPCPARTAKVPGAIHERELFLTQDTVKLSADRLLRPCFVIHHEDVEDLQAWLSLSPYHFFASFKLPSINSPWSQCKLLKRKDIPCCNICLVEKNIWQDQQGKFNDGLTALRTFDPFGGVGAFGLAMETSGCIKLTHAVEITPSAALTLQKNSPHTVVYNQCSNLVFQYAVKSHAANLSSGDTLNNLHDSSPLAKPPAPGEIDCIIAGFPCQPHSHLNMFRKASDRKSHLILNLLSWVDFLRPKFCFFENVRGFLSYSLHARQAGKYRVEGGIKMGGLKFLVYALISMGYQVRFGLLQAGHYGAPQSRVRFFLVAAQQQYPLPELPQPSHDFPLKDWLGINFSNNPSIEPILTLNGTAPMKFVSIVEAIADLPDFDWKNPQKILSSATMQDGEQRPREHIPALKCDPEKKACGISGPSWTDSGSIKYYFREPRTAFQAKCRERPTEDLQHITRVLPPATVERVVNVPVIPGADYQNLRPSLWEWQNSNPTSALARNGFRPGMYGRLDKDKWFHTTVTNVEPTAKQSYVIHPWCKRVLTVRELARSQGFPDWFVFYAVDDNVKTLQRHIGNAVPWQVSEALARTLRDALMKKWLQDREDAIEID